MDKKHYNKLVRDRIPEIIQADGRAFETETMSESDYKQALRDKVLEEGQEVATATDDELIKEIADLYEVIDALIAAYALDKDTIIETQQSRREKRGGFEQRIRLLWTE